MDLILSIALLIPLSLMLVSDIRHFRINLLVVLSALFLSAWRIIDLLRIENALQIVGLNILLMLFVLLLATLYFWIKKGKLVNPINQAIGSGDLLIFLLISFHFSPVNFVLFILLASFAAMAYKLIFLKGKDHVPLAGIYSGLLALCLLLDYVTGFNLYNDIAIY